MDHSKLIIGVGCAVAAGVIYRKSHFQQQEESDGRNGAEFTNNGAISPPMAKDLVHIPALFDEDLHLLNKEHDVDHVEDKEEWESFYSKLFKDLKKINIVGFVRANLGRSLDGADEGIIIATCTGLVAILYPEVLKKPPPSLETFFNTKKYIKIGINPLDDAKVIKRRHDSLVSGTMDLRYIVDGALGEDNAVSRSRNMSEIWDLASDQEIDKKKFLPYIHNKTLSGAVYSALASLDVFFSIIRSSVPGLHTISAAKLSEYLSELFAERFDLRYQKPLSALQMTEYIVANVQEDVPSGYSPSRQPEVKKDTPEEERDTREKKGSVLGGFIRKMSDALTGKDSTKEDILTGKESNKDRNTSQVTPGKVESRAEKSEKSISTKTNKSRSSQSLNVQPKSKTQSVTSKPSQPKNPVQSNQPKPSADQPTASTDQPTPSLNQPTPSIKQSSEVQDKGDETSRKKEVAPEFIYPASLAHLQPKPGNKLDLANDCPTKQIKTRNLDKGRSYPDEGLAEIRFDYPEFIHGRFADLRSRAQYKHTSDPRNYGVILDQVKGAYLQPVNTKMITAGNYSKPIWLVKPMKRRPHPPLKCRILTPNGITICKMNRHVAEAWYKRGYLENLSKSPVVYRLNQRDPIHLRHRLQLLVKCRLAHCNVCGIQDNLKQKHLVPRFYQRFFPADYQDHQLRTQQTLCAMCKFNSDMYDMLLKRRLTTFVKNRVKRPPTESSRIDRAVRLHHDLMDLPQFRRIMKGVREEPTEDFTLDNVIEGEAYRPQEVRRAAASQMLTWFVENEDLVVFEKLWRVNYVRCLDPQYLNDMWDNEVYLIQTFKPFCQTGSHEDLAYNHDWMSYYPHLQIKPGTKGNQDDGDKADVDNNYACIAKADEKLDSSAKVDEKLDSSAKADEKLDSSAKADEKLNSSAKADEKLDSSAKAEENLDSFANADEKMDSSSKVYDKLDSFSKSDKKRDSSSKAYEKLDSSSKAYEKLDRSSKTGKKLDSSSKVHKKLDSPA